MLKICFLLFSISFSSWMFAQQPFETDTFSTAAGDLKITFIGHGSLLFNYNNKNIYIDPYSALADYSKLPKADLILITHEHRDHLDPKALHSIQTKKTELIVTKIVAKSVKNKKIMKNGDTRKTLGLKIEAVPAYNLIHKRPNGQPYHPKGIGNGYIITFGDKRIYIAGDTENIPEIKALKDIDIAFLPMNLPYTMTPEMVAEAAQSFQPKILYPYHYGDTDPQKLVTLLKSQKNIEVRIRKMQ